jgi:hypothetical protein
MFQTIPIVLAEWAKTLFIFIKEACQFYYRLATNKASLPRWVWISMLISWVIIFVTLVRF